MPRLITLYFCLFFHCFTPNLFGYLYPSKTSVEKYLSDIQITEKKSGLSQIDCIYVINLNARPGKWKRMQKLLKKRGLKGNRVSAINGWLLPLEAQKELAGPYPVRLIPGELGCLLSHLSVLRDAQKRGFKTIWVMEDDITFSASTKRLKKMIQELWETDPNWDLFYTDRDTKDALGNAIPSLSEHNRPDQKIAGITYFLKREHVGKNLIRLRQRYGTYSMVFSKKGIDKILNYFTHIYLWSPIDMDIHYVPSLRQYAPVKDLVSIWEKGLETDTKKPPPS